MIHFGINVKEDERLTRENYISNYKQEKNMYSLDEVLENYNKNIAYFKKLNKEDFENELNKFFTKFKKFREIYDLNECDFDGLYVIVLDKYKQVYIGIADNIKKRILQHWRKRPNCLVYGNKDNSKLCIDTFKALDTTRIFVYTDSSFEFMKNLINRIESHIRPGSTLIKHVSETLEDDEAKMIKFFDNKYTCNRYIGIKSKWLRRDFT